MTKSFYGMVYRGGIALPMGVENVKFLMQHNDDIELFERFTSQDAYIWATQIYVERQNQLQRYTMPIIPQMEDLIYKAYHEQNFMEHVPTNRFFAVIANGYANFSASRRAGTKTCKLSSSMAPRPTTPTIPSFTTSLMPFLVPPNWTPTATKST